MMAAKSRFNMKSSIPAVLVIAIILFAAGSSPAQKLSTQDQVKQDVERVPCKSSDRLNAVIDLFKRVGAMDSDIQVIEKDGTRNVVVTKKGTGSGTVVIGAHYDKWDKGCGAIDNWTGIVAIAHIYGTLREHAVQKTLKFVAFDKEEQGLLGSAAFVKQISKEELPSYCSMVNLDSFGFAQPQVFRNVSTDKLIDAATAFWPKMHLKLEVATIPNADADSSSFKNAGIPAITFTGLDNHWQEFLHSSRDQVKSLNQAAVWMGYRVILPFVMALDNQPCETFLKK